MVSCFALAKNKKKIKISVKVTVSLSHLLSPPLLFSITTLGHHPKKLTLFLKF